MADPAPTKKDIDNLQKQIEAMRKTIDGLDAWAHKATETMNKDLKTLQDAVNQLIKGSK